MAEMRFWPVSRERPRGALSRVAKLFARVLLILQAQCVSEGSGKDSFSEVVLWRCYEHGQDPIEPSDKDCTKIEDAFRSVLISKDPCRITEQDYQALMKLVAQAMPCNKVLFWSKTKTLAREYAEKHDLLRPEDTLPGYMADGLKRCSALGSSVLCLLEVTTEFFPEESENCLEIATSVFWDTASKCFAENACERVQKIFNGSICDVFDSSSPSACAEVPNLETGVVSSLHAVLILEHGTQVSDSCSCSSSDMRLILNGESILFFCTENSGATSTQGDQLFLSPARGGALLIALLVTLASWTQM